MSHHRDQAYETETEPWPNFVHKSVETKTCNLQPCCYTSVCVLQHKLKFWLRACVGFAWVKGGFAVLLRSIIEFKGGVSSFV